MSLLTLGKLKTALGITESSKDAQLQTLLDMVIARVQTYCNRKFEQADYTEYYTGEDTPRLLLTQHPVTAVTNVWENINGVFGQDPGQAFDTAHLLTAGKDYVLDKSRNTIGASGILVRIGRLWPKLSYSYEIGRLTRSASHAWGNIKVEYTAGYASDAIPDDLELAITLWVSYLRTIVRFGQQLKSEDLGRWKYELATFMGDIPPEVRGALAQYREEFI